MIQCICDLGRKNLDTRLERTQLIQKSNKCTFGRLTRCPTLSPVCKFVGRGLLVWWFLGSMLFLDLLVLFSRYLKWFRRCLQ